MAQRGGHKTTTRIGRPVQEPTTRTMYPVWHHDNRKRSTSVEERDLLMGLIAENRSLLLGEANNESAATQKNEAWARITEAFNGARIGPERSRKQLKLTWDHIKRRVQKKSDKDTLLGDNANTAQIMSMIFDELAEQQNGAEQKGQRPTSQRQTPCSTLPYRPQYQEPPYPATDERIHPTTSYEGDGETGAPQENLLDMSCLKYEEGLENGTYLEDINNLKHREHELEMKVKNTNLECSEMDKELKTLNKKIMMIDHEVKEMQLELFEIAIKNKKLQQDTLKKELENAKEKDVVIQKWGEAAEAVKQAAVIFTQKVKQMNL